MRSLICLGDLDQHYIRFWKASVKKLIEEYSMGEDTRSKAVLTKCTAKKSGLKG